MARFQIPKGPFKRSRRGEAWMVFLCLTSLWFAHRVGAQGPGQLTGTVKDATDAPLVGVTVAVRGSVTRVVHSGSGGQFAFPDLPEGQYELIAEKAGFAPERRTVRIQRDYAARAT